jgi:hypothetical protein
MKCVLTSGLEDIQERIDDQGTPVRHPKPNYEAALRWNGNTSVLPKRDKVKCPKCEVEIKRSRLEKHIRKAHKLKRKSKNKISKSPNQPVIKPPLLIHHPIQASELANELGVELIIIMNETGRRGVKIQSQSRRIPHRIAERIRDYIRWDRRQKGIRVASRRI